MAISMSVCSERECPSHFLHGLELSKGRSKRRVRLEDPSVGFAEEECQDSPLIGLDSEEIEIGSATHGTLLMRPNV